MRTILFFKSSGYNAIRKRISGFMSYAKKKDWDVQILEPIRNARELKTAVDFWNPDGCVVCCASGLNNYPSNRFRSPVVYVDRPRGMSSAADSYGYHDSTAMTKTAMRELLSLKLKSYAYVGYRNPKDWDRERQQAFESCLSPHGAEPIVFPGGVDLRRLHAGIRRLVRWIGELPKPAGIFAATDILAREVINAAHLANVSIPNDLAVIGIDNDEDVCEYVRPTLSSVEPDFRSAGYEAAAMLDELMRPGAKGSIRRFHAELRLVRRESTRRLKRNDRFVADALERIRQEACFGLHARAVLADFPCGRRMAETRFRDLTGRSILEEIRCVRLERAKELLRETDAKLSAIANWCGYDSPAAFAVFFKSETGMTPRQFAKSCQRP